jgi:hypothetical protein
MKYSVDGTFYHSNILVYRLEQILEVSLLENLSYFKYSETTRVVESKSAWFGW